MTLKLYSVTLTADIVVVAESAAHAEEIAEQERYDLDCDSYHASADQSFYMPVGWDENAIPYGAGDPKNPDKTIAEWRADAKGLAAPSGRPAE